MQGVDQRDDSAVSSRLENSFMAVLLLPSAFAPPNFAHTPFVLCQTYIENFPVSVLICRWSLDGKGETAKTKAG